MKCSISQNIAFFFPLSDIQPIDVLIFVGDGLNFSLKVEQPQKYNISNVFFQLRGRIDSTTPKRIAVIDYNHGYFELIATEEYGGRNSAKFLHKNSDGKFEQLSWTTLHIESE